MSLIESQTNVALRLELSGLVQGVGLRPAVARLADALGLVGFVRNNPSGVECVVEGPAASVEEFQKQFADWLPSPASVVSQHFERISPRGFRSFEIHPSSSNSERARVSDHLHVPPDTVLCSACRDEVEDPANRRHQYGFTSCTACGPRYSIIDRLPFDRAQTSMDTFPLCSDCRSEYDSSTDRRFHAQSLACPACGPEIWLRDTRDARLSHGREAIRAASAALLDGKILALRGVGGYQLLVDATSETAVGRLRARKRRCGKPFAVMAASLAAANELVTLRSLERDALIGPAGPIVIAETKRHDVAPSVTRGLNSLGVMLPSTPVHQMLASKVRVPLVCTSANTEGDPLPYHADVAFSELHGIADLWLEHNRAIRRPIDDSVVRVMGDQAVVLRSARGYAPTPLSLESDHPLVAVGGHQKVALALSNGGQSALGPHLGDMQTTAARVRLQEQALALKQLYGVREHRWICDYHPDYFTTRWTSASKPIQVQHHHAHVAAGMLEHDWLQEEVLGVAFDGTGYGPDGTVWGGEFLRTRTGSYQRVGHLRTFALVGGDRCSQEPWRVATALVAQAAGLEAAAGLHFNQGCAESLLPLLSHDRFAIATSSVGRLFDGVAALVLGIDRSEFEGQAAMLLESTCDPTAAGRYEMLLDRDSMFVLDWRPMIREILADRAAGVAPGTMAMRFHRGLAAAVFQICRTLGDPRIVFSGGVFQNRVFTELLMDYFSDCQQRIGLPARIPPNDGGLAAGQLAVGLHALSYGAISCA